MQIKRAIISVSDKTGIVNLAEELQNLNIEIISTGGTAKLLRKNNINVKDVSELTGFPEIMEGRVKTLHPKVHGGILAKRDKESHLKIMRELGIEPIDLVVVNLYPFKETIERNADFAEIVENIDIGGPSMIRAAAKNFKYVAVLTDIVDYQRIIDEIKTSKTISLRTRYYLAKKAFNLTAHYDAMISNFLNGVDEKGFPIPKPEFERFFTPTFVKAEDLRYGENPHQRAAFYREEFVDEPCVANSKKIWGNKEISFNNIYDLDSALNIVLEFDKPACTIVKHANPCGVAIGKTPREAYEKALETDPLSAFGGIIAFNTTVTNDVAELISKRFYECIVAPDYDGKALEALQRKKNLRVLKLDKLKVNGARSRFDMRKVVGGLLVQDRDLKVFDGKLKVASNRKPTEKELQDLRFAFTVAKWVKSNAIVYAKDNKTIGIGVGQTSRVDSARCAAEKAQLMGLSLDGSVMASDGFLPFADNVEEAAKHGVTAIIQPGGSIRDREVIEAANSHNMAMVFTGIRHFRH